MRWPFLFGGTAVAVAVAVGWLASSWTSADTQYVHDAYIAWAEPVPDEVAAIGAATGMSVEGELIYRASTPAIEDDDAFNQHCALEGGAVLGCYFEGEIYVYAVTDERLAGTVEVTAAHEMLHAAYERLPVAERERVDALVTEAIAALDPDDPVFAALELYAETQRADEWHSRLGVQYAELPAGLEAHYARYFDDRGKVVALHVQANAVFIELQAQIQALVAEVETSRPVLEARLAAYESAVAAFNAEVADFNTRAQNGSFSSQAQFDSERADLLARGDALDAERLAVDAEVLHYNGLVAQLTALDADYADLYSALDSSDDADAVSP